MFTCFLVSWLLGQGRIVSITPPILPAVTTPNPVINGISLQLPTDWPDQPLLDMGTDLKKCSLPTLLPACTALSLSLSLCVCV